MITFDLEELVEEIHKRGIFHLHRTKKRPRGQDMGRDIHAALFDRWRKSYATPFYFGNLLPHQIDKKSKGNHVIRLAQNG
jgi:hypothetical protein